MTMPHRRFLPVAVLSAVCFGFVSGPTAAEDTRLSAAKSVYEKSVKELQDRCAAKINNWPADYSTQIRNLQTRMQKAGDLDGWQAAKKELDRFETARKIADADLVAAPPELRAIQTAFKDLSAQQSLERDKDIMALYKRYSAHLDGLKKDLTIAGKFDDAVAVSAEMKRVQSSPEVTAAEFAVTAQEARSPAKEPSPPKETAPDKSAPPPDDTDKTSYPLQTADGATIHGPGRRASPIADVSFKRASLTDTEYTPLARNMSANLWIGSQGSTHHVRLTLNTSATDVTAKDITVVVEFYVKLTVRAGKRPDPFALDVLHIVVPAVKSQWNFIDCPRVEIPSPMDLYGVVVSVFNAGNTLEFQGVFPPTAKPLASPKMQPPKRLSLRAKP